MDHLRKNMRTLYTWPLTLLLLLMKVGAASAQTGHYEWNSLPFGGARFVSGIITCPQEPDVVYTQIQQ